ncbi:purine phosphoribosyltransferase family protein Apf [Lycorma delicatula]|uniref:purine phosphoribosyltransferase family protein Apf n=1 Tax=Lycorma delicatula TaxID=130591 RepID=UPI003F50EAF4
MAVVKAGGFLLYQLQPVVEFLLLQASYGERHWSPPKGHVDKGEDEMAAAVRETEEETGLVESQFKIDHNFKRVLEYVVNGRPKRVVYWLAELVDKNAVDDIKLSKEHNAYVWCDLERGKNYVKYEKLQELLTEAHCYILNKTQTESSH